MTFIRSSYLPFSFKSGAISARFFPITVSFLAPEWNNFIAASLLLIISAGISCLLEGLFQFNIASHLFSRGSMVERTVYILIGLAAIYTLPLFKRTWLEFYETSK